MRFRCCYCNADQGGIEFEADGPKCPSCQRENAALIFELVDVHWLGQHPNGPMVGHNGGRIAIACMQRRPNVADLSATGEMTATTCKQCQDSEMFQAEWMKWADQFPDLTRSWLKTQKLKTFNP